MNLALVKKSLAESRRLFLASAALIFAFHWLRVWLTGQLPLAQLRLILDNLPEIIKRLSPVPLEQIATSAGRIALSYDDPVVLLLVTVWAIARGSDAVSGELGRGTMELLLAQPLRRSTVLWTHAAVTILGAGLLAACAWLGTAVGLATVTLEEPVSARLFVPAALNLFGFTFFLCGLTTLVSSADRDRWRTISIVGTIYIVETIVRLVAILANGWRWLSYCTFFTVFDPERLVANPELAWSWQAAAPYAFVPGGLFYDAVLFGLGIAFYTLATVIFCRRDLPAPL